MPLDLFGFTIGRKKPTVGSEAILSRPVSFVPPDPEDGASYVDASAGFFGQFVDFEGSIKNERDLIYKYREMSLHSEVDAAIDDVVNEAIVQDDIKQTLQLDLEDVDLPDPVKDKVNEEFDHILKMLNFKNRGYDIFRKWYIEGKTYYHAVIDPANPKKGLLELRPVDAAKIQKIKSVKKKTLKDKQGRDAVKVVDKVEEYYLFMENENVPEQQGLKIYPDAIVYCHSGLYDLQKKRVYGNLHKAIKPLNQLRMIEDAVVIYRISRAPERRIFYIDVGSLPKNKAEQYLRDVMNRYRNKLVYDANTGEIRDDRRFQSMLEDFWLPRREGGRGTEISTLPGGENLGQMDDVEYFKKKLYRSLGVPSTRLEADNGFNMGRSSEITRDELKFFKMIEKLRQKFSEMFTQALRIQLVLKGVMKEEEFDKIKNDIRYEYARDSYFTELKDAEILENRMGVLRDMSDHVGNYYSHEFIRKKVLHQTDEEIKEIDAQIQKEREDGKIKKDTKEFY